MDITVEKFHAGLIKARNQVFENALKLFQKKAIEGHLFGSVGRKDADAYSDLDLWLTFKDQKIQEILAKRFEYYSQIGQVIHICEPPQNRPINGVHSFILYKTPAGLLQVDYYLCPESTSFLTEGSQRVFGEIELPQGRLGFNPQKVAVDDSYRTDFVIIFVFIAIKYLVRKKKNALEDLFREYDYLSDCYGILINPLENREHTLGVLRQIIVNLEKVSNDKQKLALSEIDDFLLKTTNYELQTS